MTPLEAPAPADLHDFARLYALAAETRRSHPATRNGRATACGASASFCADSSPPGAPGSAVDHQVGGIVRIIDTLDADLSRGGVRSITGLTRQVRRLEATTDLIPTPGSGLRPAGPSLSSGLDAGLERVAGGRR